MEASGALEVGGEKSCCGQLAFREESGLGNSVTFTFSEVSLCEVSVFYFL